MEPVYTADNTTAAYQLNWSLAIFGKSELPESTNWLDGLKAATESDGVRILSLNVRSENVLQFLISTRPASAPSDCVRSVKGRLQYLIRDLAPKAFRRNYHIHSVGEATSSTLDNYVAGQTTKHPMADPKVQALLESNQFYDKTIDLSEPAIGTYGQYLNSLQIVLENADGWNEVREAELNRLRELIISVARKKGWMLARIGLLSNHVHILLGAPVTISPQTVALSLMNNIAYVYGMKPILKYSFYAGTFGSYDRGAVRLDTQQIAGSAGTSPDGGPIKNVGDGSCQL